MSALASGENQPPGWAFMQRRDSLVSSMAPQSLRMCLKAWLTFSQEKKALPLGVCMNSMKMLLRGNPTSSLWLNLGPSFTAESIISTTCLPEYLCRVLPDFSIPVSQFSLSSGSEQTSSSKFVMEGSQSWGIWVSSLACSQKVMKLRMTSRVTPDSPPSVTLKLARFQESLWADFLRSLRLWGSNSRLVVYRSILPENRKQNKLTINQLVAVFQEQSARTLSCSPQLQQQPKMGVDWRTSAGVLNKYWNWAEYSRYELQAFVLPPIFPSHSVQQSREITVQRPIQVEPDAGTGSHTIPVLLCKSWASQQPD